MPSFELEVRRAFDENEFFPVFQPIVEIRTGQLAGFEALGRWNHVRLGAVPPDEFIPVVEKCGLIDELTQIVLERAFASPEFVKSTLSLSINISPVQLLSLKPSEQIAPIAKRSGFSLDRLTIEITESALFDDLDRAKAVAEELKALQCKLALDDFGTGYSSLKHLHALPFDELKVDRSFVNSMIQMRESRKIVSSVVGLGQSLGLITVAEGVETQEQADLLLRMGCELGQGWLYGKPSPASALPDLVSPDRWTLPFRSRTLSDENSIMSLDALPAQRLAQLQAIYDGVPVGLCFLDKNLRYVSLNRRLAEMNGVSAAEHLGRTPRDVIPKVFKQVEKYIRRALAGEAIPGVEVKKPGNDGDETGKVLLISYQPVRDEAGEVIGVSVAIMDITESKRIEDALREEEEHSRQMMNLNPHVPWVLNTKGEVTEASANWESITGQSMEQALGNGWLQMLHPEDVAPTEEAIRTSLGTGLPIDIKYRVRRPGGEWMWMRSRGAPRFGPTGKIVCIYGVVEEMRAEEPA
jgi:PAS domain S-box-containing protein